MPALTIRLPQDAAAALRDLALVECRAPRDQAAFLVIQGFRAAAAAGETRRPRRQDVRPRDDVPQAKA